MDHDFFQTMGIKILEGRSFMKWYSTDTATKFIINEEAVRQLGFESAINQRIIWQDDDSVYRGEIIGVVEDFHYGSLYENINPLVLMFKPSEYNYLLVRISPEEITKTLTFIKRIWEENDKLFTFEYSFLEDDLNKRYQNEESMGQIYWIFTCLALIIALLGLYGLSTFSIEHKTKEIGVRKVHGASVLTILMAFWKEYSIWILVAYVIACPFGYFIMIKWLQNYAYQVKPALWIFLVAGLITEVVAIMAITYQSMRAAIKNPVDPLRYE